MSVPFTYLPLSLTLTGHMNNDTIYFNFYSYQILSTVPGGTSFLIHGLHKSVLYWFVFEDFSILSFCGWLPFKPPYGKKTTLDHLILSTALLALNFSLFLWAIPQEHTRRSVHSTVWRRNPREVSWIKESDGVLRFSPPFLVFSLLLLAIMQGVILKSRS